MAGAGEGEHVAGTLHQEQVRGSLDIRQTRPHSSSLSAWLPGVAAGGAGRV